VLDLTKEHQFAKRKPNKNKIRLGALRRIRIREQIEYLRKIGKIEEVSDSRYSKKKPMIKIRLKK